LAAVVVFAVLVAFQSARSTASDIS